MSTIIVARHVGIRAIRIITHNYQLSYDLVDQQVFVPHYPTEESRGLASDALCDRSDA